MSKEFEHGAWVKKAKFSTEKVVFGPEQNILVLKRQGIRLYFGRKVRYCTRFFVQVGHETTHASNRNKHFFSV